MKGKNRLVTLGAMTAFMLLVSMGTHAATTAWAKVTEIHFRDSYSGIFRVRHDIAVPVNPAACPEGATKWIDIEINPSGRSAFEMEQMVNSIYLSMATSRNVKFNIDGVRCSPDGFRLGTGVSAQSL